MSVTYTRSITLKCDVCGHTKLFGRLSEATARVIAQREGWHCFRCNRGPFHVMEVWIENESMVEILPPEFAREYLAFTRPDKVAAAMAAAAPATSRQRPA